MPRTTQEVNAPWGAGRESHTRGLGGPRAGAARRMHNCATAVLLRRALVRGVARVERVERVRLALLPVRRVLQQPAGGQACGVLVHLLHDAQEPPVGGGRGRAVVEHRAVPADLVVARLARVLLPVFATCAFCACRCLAPFAFFGRFLGRL